MNSRICKECHRPFTDHSTEEFNVNSWTGMTAAKSNELALKDDWIYVCPYCDSIFLRTNEEHRIDMANKVMNMYMRNLGAFQ